MDNSLLSSGIPSWVSTTPTTSLRALRLFTTTLSSFVPMTSPETPSWEWKNALASSAVVWGGIPSRRRRSSGRLAGELAICAGENAEQDFIAPENVQALIWRDVVPSLLTSAILPRWWGVSRNELHAVALYQRAGEELLSASAENAELRSKVMSILPDRMSPQTIGTTGRCSSCEKIWPDTFRR